jgi:serine protease Do
MYRRFTLLIALAAGSLATLAALPLVSAWQHKSTDASMLASDARAASSTANDVKQVQPLSSLPSLAPLVKQLRPVVVNINSRFKPHRQAVAQRSPRNRMRPQPQQPPSDGNDDGSDEEDQGGGQQDPMERFFRFFGQQGQGQQDEQERHGLGSGFLIGDGLVLTNNHVVEIQDENGPRGKFRPMDEIKVVTDESAPGGAREFKAKVIGNDPKADIALLRIEGKDVGSLKYATLGDSDAIEVGDYVVAIGEPFGLQATVTTGIISAKERSQFGGAYSDYLQTDASINPGNSGGPLFNLKGEVVGINAAIISGANTIGFAIPIAVVKQILPQLKEKGRVSRGYLGVQPQAVTGDMVEQLGLKSTKGALLADVPAGGPGAKAGLKPGDVVVALNSKAIADNNQLTRDVGAVPPGQVVHLSIVRDGKERNIDVELGTRPDETDAPLKNSKDSSGETEKGDLLGLSVQDLNPQLARRAQVEPGTKGAVITDVAPDSPGSEASLEPGDLVLEINRQPVGSVGDYRKLVKSLKKGDSALLRVKRGGGGSAYVPLTVK